MPGSFTSCCSLQSCFGIKTVFLWCRYFWMSVGHLVKMVLMYYTYWSSHSPPCWVGNGSISLKNIELETLVIINVVLFKGRCLTVESTFKNIRPVSWSQQDTSPCLICDFMQHFIYCLLHFMLLFIYVFSFFSLVLLSSSLGFDASIRKNLENRKNHAKIFSYEKETAISLMKFGQSWIFFKKM